MSACTNAISAGLSIFIFCETEGLHARCFHLQLKTNIIQHEIMMKTVVESFTTGWHLCWIFRCSGCQVQARQLYAQAFYATSISSTTSRQVIIRDSCIVDPRIVGHHLPWHNCWSTFFSNQFFCVYLCNLAGEQMMQLRRSVQSSHHGSALLLCSHKLGYRPHQRSRHLIDCCWCCFYCNGVAWPTHEGTPITVILSIMISDYDWLDGDIATIDLSLITEVFFN